MNWEFQATPLAATLPAEAGMDSLLKRAQIIWGAMLLAAFFYVLLPEWIRVKAQPVNNILLLVIAFLAIFMLSSILWFRKKMASSDEILRNSPGDQVAAKRWMAGQILTFALAEAIVLYGLVLRLMGTDRLKALPFYILGMGALIVFRPKRIE
jgi:amino acid transporter